MFLVLEAICIPRGLLNVAVALYRDGSAYAEEGGTFVFLFKMLSGVLQGCPLSGTLFVIAIDPLLVMFHRFIHEPKLGMVRACADDIGATLNQLRTL